jgi:MFS family permease
MSGGVMSMRTAAWPERAAVVAIFFGNGVGIGAWAACIPALKAGLALSDGALGLVLFAFAVGAVLLMQLAARLTLRLGPAKATRAAILLFGFALPLPALAPGFATLAVAAFAVGAANGLLDVTMNGYASDVERRWGGAIMSSFHAAWSAGVFAGAALGGALLVLGVSETLGGAAALVAGFAALAWTWLQDGEASPQRAHAHLAPPLGALLPLCLAALLCMCCEGAMGDWVGVYLMETAHTSQAMAPIGFAAFSATMVAGRLLGDNAVRAWGRARVVRWGATLAAGGLALAVIDPRLGPATLGFALVGVGLSNVVPTLFSAAAGLAPVPAAGVAMVATAGYAGLLSGPVVIGAIAQGASLRLAIAFLILSLAAAAVAARSLRDSATTPSATPR